MHLEASIDAIKWLTFQYCTFRGHDESLESKNGGNFLEMLKLLACYDKEVKEVVLQNAPQSKRYISPTI